jgi:hypothetical protein
MRSSATGADGAPRGSAPVSRRLLLGIGGLAMAITGCSAPPQSLMETTATGSAAIIGGTLATSYPESTFVDLYAKGSYIAACSGALIAPIVAITAAHCITGVPGSIPDSWVVTAPYAGKTPTKVFGTAVYDYTLGTENITPTQHDVGLLFLDTPVMLSSYPTIQTTELMDGSEVVNIGRMNNGVLSTTDMYVSADVAVMDGSEISPPFPYDYAAMDVIESGDSGGPDELPGLMTPHVIVAVNSGDGMSTEVLARTDPINTWIAMEVMTHMTPPVIDAGVDSAMPATGAEDSGAPPAQDSGGIPSLSGPPPGGVAFPSSASSGCAVGGARGSRDEGSPGFDAAWLALGAALLWRGKRRRS